jgi:acetyltransferase-like isoleucine patch superfamily enzyme
MILIRPGFKSYGKKFIFDPDGDYSYNTITVGESVFIGKGAMIMAPDTQVEIGNHVMIGPKVMIRGGNHRMDVIGSYMDDVKIKRPEDDQKVIIEDDVWIGANVTILKGSYIREGSVIGACSLVNGEIPPYSVAVGVPAKPKKIRFTNDEIHEHKKLLN